MTYELSFLLFFTIGTIFVFTVVAPLMTLAELRILLSSSRLNGNRFNTGYT